MNLSLTTNYAPPSPCMMHCTVSDGVEGQGKQPWRQICLNILRGYAMRPYSKFSCMWKNPMTLWIDEIGFFNAISPHYISENMFNPFQYCIRSRISQSAWLGIYPVLFSIRGFLNSWPINSNHWSYMISVCLVYLVNHVVSTHFVIDIDILSSYCVIL